MGGDPPPADLGAQTVERDGVGQGAAPKQMAHGLEAVGEREVLDAVAGDDELAGLAVDSAESGPDGDDVIQAWGEGGGLGAHGDALSEMKVDDTVRRHKIT